MLHRLRRALLVAPALAIALALVAAGCGGGSGSGGGAVATSTTAGSAAREAAARQFVQCARQNGIPNLQDPTVNAHGDLELPTSPPGLSERSPLVQHVIQVCGHFLQGVLTTREGNNQQGDDALVRFSQCMRQHGLPSFPDPNFSQNPPLPLRTMNTADAAFQHAMAACQSLLKSAKGG
jgi:hypothetical protein